MDSLGFPSEWLIFGYIALCVVGCYGALHFTRDRASAMGLEELAKRAAAESNPDNRFAHEVARRWQEEASHRPEWESSPPALKDEPRQESREVVKPLRA